MFGKIKLYLFTNMFIRIIFIAATLTLVVALVLSLSVMQDFGRAINFSSLAFLTVLSVPYFLVEIIPLAVFFTVLFTLSQLIKDRELVAIEAIGMSPYQTSTPSLVLAIIFTIITYLFCIFAIPFSYQQFEKTTASLESSAYLFLEEGKFNKIDEKTNIYFQSRDVNNVMKNVQIIYVDDDLNKHIIFANEGLIEKSNSGKLWVLFSDGKYVSSSLNNENMVNSTFKSYRMEVPSYSQDRVPKRLKAKGAKISELYNPEKINIDKKYHEEFFDEALIRTFSPIFTIIYVLIAIAFMQPQNLLRRSHALVITLASLYVIIIKIINLSIVFSPLPLKTSMYLLIGLFSLTLMIFTPKALRIKMSFKASLKKSYE